MFKAYHPNVTQPARSILVLHEDSSGTVWCGTEGGLYRLEEVEGQVKFHFVDLGLRIEGDESIVDAILEDRRGALWVGTRGSGLLRRSSDGRVEHYGTEQGLPIQRITALLEDQQGRLWVGTTLGLGLVVEDSKAHGPVITQLFQKKNSGLPSDWVEDIFQTSDGRLWIALAGGLSELLPATAESEPRFQSYAPQQGLSQIDLTSLAEDTAGNLWIGATSGAMKLARNGFVTHTNAEGNQFGVGGIFETKTGELCFITQFIDASRFAVIRYDTKRLSVVRPSFPKTITNFGFGWNQIGLQDREGDYWFATGQGLWRFPGGNSVEQLAHAAPKGVYTSKNGLMHDSVWRIFEDSRGDIWIGTTSAWSGVTRWERTSGTFHHYSQTEGLLSQGWAAAFAEDSAGSIWIGIGNSVVRYSEGHFKLLTTPTSSPSGAINAFHVDVSGRLWIATDTGGLLRVDDPKTDHPVFINYSTARGLSSNQVWCVTSDVMGNIYAFTGRGVDSLNPATDKVKHYTTADGLVGGAPKTAFRDRRGTLWFGTDRGFSQFSPEPERARPTLPILISGLRVGGEPRPLSELGEVEVPEIKLGPNDNQVQIDYVGLNFKTGERLKYQYKLEGIDSDWSSATEQRSVNYARLAPGNYEFVVRAIGSDGSISQSPARASFTILPPLWQRWWFVLIVAVTLGLMAYALYRYRLSRLLELERVRTRLATDLHDDIGSNLSLIAMASEVANRQAHNVDEQMAGWLSLISTTSRETVDSMSDIVWAVNPAKDRLSDLIQRMRRVAEETLTARNIDLRFTAPEKDAEMRLGAETRREVFLVFKEGVNNIARHSQSTQAELSLKVSGGLLVLKLSDNGLGFDPSSVDEGNGLASMRRRAEKLSGKLVTDSQPGAGTSITLTVPLDGQRRVR